MKIDRIALRQIRMPLVSSALRNWSSLESRTRPLSVIPNAFTVSAIWGPGVAALFARGAKPVVRGSTTEGVVTP